MELEDKFEALKEATVSSLRTCRKELQELRGSVENMRKTQDSLKETVDSMMKSIDGLQKKVDDVNKTVPVDDMKRNIDKGEPRTPQEREETEEHESEDEDEDEEEFGPPSKLKKTSIPETLFDLKSIVRKKIEAFAEEKRTKSDVLTPVQAIWLHWWITTKNAKGKHNEVVSAIEAGVDDGIWPRGWSPPNSRTTLFHYLKDKMKGVARRNSVEKTKTDILNLIMDAGV